MVLEACAFWEHTYDAAATVASSVILSHPYKTIERFSKIDQVSAYCGLAPSTYQS